MDTASADHKVGAWAYRQAGRSGLHAVFLTALAGSHGLVGSRSVGLGAKGILGKFLVIYGKMGTKAKGQLIYLPQLNEAHSN